MRGNMLAERSRRGLSAREVASAIGVHVNTLTGWESGEHEPLGQKILSLAQFYGCSPEYLLEVTDDRNATAVVE